MTKVINLFGGPGSGKSTTAAGLFYQMKIRSIKCELVTEYAKDMTYEKRSNILEDQLYILAKQNRKLSRLQEVVDYIITDSPLVLGLIYTLPKYYSTFEPLVHQVFKSYNNENFFINRSGEYQEYGRNQTEFEAKELDSAILTLLNTNYDYILLEKHKAIDSILKELKIK